MGRRISDEDLCAELRRVAEELGEVPTVRQFDDHGAYSEVTLRKRFGSWSDALEAAGLDASGSKRPVPEEELLEELRELAADLGQPPTVQQMDEQGPRWSRVYARRFGSWNEALEAAGLASRSSNGSMESVPRSELLAALEALDDDLERRPRTTDMDDHGAFAVRQYRDAFGSWTAALEAAGIDTDDISSRIPTETLVDAIRTVADACDAPPTTTQFNEQAAYSAATVRRRFGSWDEALEAAGLDPDTPRKSNRTGGGEKKISDAELLGDIRRLADENADADDPATDDSGADAEATDETSFEAPTLQEYRDRGAYGAQTMYERFGSWNAAVEAAGFRARDSDSKIPKPELVAELRRLGGDDDEPPTAAEMRAEGAYWARTYRDRFGSWNEALEAAGFTPDARGTSTSTPSRAALTTELQELASELDRRPRKADMRADGRYSPHTYATVFESWSAAVEAAGFDPQTISNEVSDDALLDEIRRMADELGKRPSAREMDDEGRYATATYQRRFGSWSKALETALADSPREEQ